MNMKAEEMLNMLVDRRFELAFEYPFLNSVTSETEENPQKNSGCLKYFLLEVGSYLLAFILIIAGAVAVKNVLLLIILFTIGISIMFAPFFMYVLRKTSIPVHYVNRIMFIEEIKDLLKNKIFIRNIWFIKIHIVFRLIEQSENLLVFKYRASIIRIEIREYCAIITSFTTWTKKLMILFEKERLLSLRLYKSIISYRSILDTAGESSTIHMIHLLNSKKAINNCSLMEFLHGCLLMKESEARNDHDKETERDIMNAFKRARQMNETENLLNDIQLDFIRQYEKAV